MAEENFAKRQEPLDDAKPVTETGLASALALEAVEGGISHPEARDFIHKQSVLAEKSGRLADQQMRFLKLREKYYAEDLQIERIEKILKITVQVLLILTGLVVVIAFGALVWWASHAQSVVMEEFDTPPGLAQRGNTGRVVASGVLDELSKLQAVTRGSVGKRALKSAWTGDIKIEIPSTGISLGELLRTLREMLGHDVHVGGTLVESADGGLTLTVRGDDVMPKTFTGGATELPKLMREAAEYVYGEAEPYLYAVYLSNTGRYEDGQKFLEQAYPRAGEHERPELANTWGNLYAVQGKTHEAAQKYRLAVLLNPRFWKSWGNLVGVLMDEEGEEAALRAANEMRARAKTAPRDDQPRPAYYNVPDSMVQDWPAVVHDFQEDARYNSGAGSSSSLIDPTFADAYAQMHDWATTAKYVAAFDPEDPSSTAQALLVDAYKALDRDNFSAAIPPLEGFYKLWQSDTSIQYSYADYPCILALAYGLTGRAAEAEAIFKKTGRWVRCAAYRADVLARTAPWPEAVRAYQSALALAPSLPFAYDRWGLALATRGDLNGAAAAFREANKRGQHWAEPLKHWGDVLMRQHRANEALAKYQEALKYAPAWSELQAARDKAAR